MPIDPWLANEWLNCSGQCANDYDSDAVCDQFEIAGCQDENAVNFNPDATDSYYNLNTSQPVPCYFVGCQDENALNYDPNANANGPCDYPIYQLDWSFTATDPMQSSILAIVDIEGLPGYDFEVNSVFCDAVTVGAFYSNTEFSEFNNSYVDADFSGYSNGSDWNCLPDQPYPYLALFVDDNTTSVKDGFDPGEPMIFIVELDGVEYLAEPNFASFSDISSPEFQVASLYIVSLEIIEPVEFGCTDMDYLEYWDYDQNNASIEAPETIPNLDDGSCVTDIIVGCMDPVSATFDPEANINNDTYCAYWGCTDPDYLEYWNYDPINYTINDLTNPATEGYDDGSCTTLIVEGCTDVTAFNYNSSSNVEDNSCVPIIEGCTDESMFTLDHKNLISVKIGKGKTHAKLRLNNPKKLREHLIKLVGT